LTYHAIPRISKHMRCVVAPVIRGFGAAAALLVLGFCAVTAIAADGIGPGEPDLITNLWQLGRNAGQTPQVSRPFQIAATVLAADPAADVLVLRDSSAIEIIQVNLQGRRLEPGTIVSLDGTGCGVRRRCFGLAVVPGLAVDNDGLHGMATESGTVFLHAGLNPVAAQWFNRAGSFGLTVAYEGPGVARQPIPGAALMRATVEAATGRTNFSAGLDYQCYEGGWGHLPNFAKIQPAKTGVATNFDLGMRTRDPDVALQFSGYLAIPREGWYRFQMASDDGSRRFVGDSHLEIRVMGQGRAPQAVENVLATPPAGDERPWATIEGTLNFLGSRGGHGEVALQAGNNDIRVEVIAGGDSAPTIPVDTRVRVTGVYQSVVGEDGLRVPGMLLAASWNVIRPVPAAEGGRVLAADRPTPNSTPGVTATAFGATALAAITTAADIKALSAEEAGKQLPVSIRGVVTAVLPRYLRNASVQDSTKGVSVMLPVTATRVPCQRRRA